MSSAQEYYDSLLHAGYDEAVALEYTIKYYPDFAKTSPLTDQSQLVSENNKINRGHFIPVSSNRIFSKLMMNDEIEIEKRSDYENIIVMLEAIWHHSAHEQLRFLKSRYELLEPVQSNHSYTRQQVDEFVETFEEVLTDGNWVPISQNEIDEALDGEDVLPISLDVRFDEFRNMRLYKLGVQKQTVHVKKFFGLKKEAKKVIVFDNVITLLEFQDDEWFATTKKRLKQKIDGSIGGVHLRLFRDVPHLDLEVIFPNTSPSMRTLDKVKIAAPLIGGVVSIGLKYIPLLFGGPTGNTSLSVLGGLLAGLGTYVLKTYTSYQKTRETFRKIVARDMYFKGMANDAPVLSYIIDMAESQEVKEAVLAYVFLSLESNGLSEEQLDKRVEDWLEQTFGVRIDFEVDDAISKLSDINLLRTSDGIFTVVDTSKALRILDEYWDGLYDF